MGVHLLSGCPRKRTSSTPWRRNLPDQLKATEFGQIRRMQAEVALPCNEETNLFIFNLLHGNGRVWPDSSWSHSSMLRRSECSHFRALHCAAHTHRARSRSESRFSFSMLSNVDFVSVGPIVEGSGKPCRHLQIANICGASM